MTDRISHLTVSLDRDYRDDDVEVIIRAIEMIKGVAQVNMGEPVNMNDHIARGRAVMALREQIDDVFNNFQFPK